MKKSNDGFNKKLFCCYFVKLGNIQEAAIKAGASREEALILGIDCLKNPSSQKLLSELFRYCKCNSNSIMAGLERLAFGNSNDAVFLAFAEDIPSPSLVSELDLFNVSEIKKVKGGGVEIKLFDRLKAFEKMYEFLNSSDSENIADSLINALTSDGGDDS